MPTALLSTRIATAMADPMTSAILDELSVTEGKSIYSLQLDLRTIFDARPPHVEIIRSRLRKLVALGLVREDPVKRSNRRYYFAVKGVRVRLLAYEAVIKQVTELAQEELAR